MIHANASATQVEEESQLAKAAQPIVQAVIRKLQREIGYQVDPSDLASIANESLVNLVRRYDPAIAPFAPYLARHLRWALLDQLRRRSNRPLLAGRIRSIQALDRIRDTTHPKALHRPPLDEEQAQVKLQRQLRLRATTMALPFLAQMQGQTTGSARPRMLASPETRCQARQRALRVRERVAQLDEPDRTLVTRHYFEDEPFNEIAQSLGLSKWQACRIHKRALQKLAASWQSE